MSLFLFKPSDLPDASAVDYQPASLSNWLNSDPKRVKQALDRLVARLKSVEDNGGGGTGAAASEHRSAFALPYSYYGTAAADTAEDADGWTVTRISVSATGTVTVTHATGAWTARAALTYT